MANRRMGGMGGPHRGNRFSQPQPFQGNNVNPWQGGSSNNSMNAGLISQLTSNPQQLALALTSLLQPQQVNNPPSLLSLNTTPGFNNHDRNVDRFGNRGRDFRRHEPYNNKNRGGGWRQLDGRNRNNNNRRDNNTNNNKDRKPRDNNKDNKDTKKKEEKKPEKKEETETSVDETNEDGDENTKRDWKEEKNNSEEKNEEGTEKEKKSENKDGKYHGVPQKFLNCYICNKEMWDGESMQKHVRGRAHKQMLNSLEESIHSTVKILRENMRLQEEKKLIELNRMNRIKKYNRYQDTESYCNMCDLKFMGKIIGHRKTEGHQRLKRYLHPSCHICDKEFPSRMDWIEHRLTPEHLRSLSADLEKRAGQKDGDAIIDDQEIDIEQVLDEALQLESENPILELKEDMDGLQNLIPAYKKDRKVSTQSLKEFSGFMCELCHRSFPNDELAQEHLKTRRHYYAFIDAAKKLYQKQIDEEKKKKDAAAKEKKKDSEEKTEEPADMYDPEEACNEEEEDAAEKNEEDEVEEEEEEEVMEKEEEEIPEETKPEEEEEIMEVQDEVEEVKEEPKVKEEAKVKEEVKAEPPATPSRPTRKSGAVRNGAGPKSKKARKN